MANLSTLSSFTTTATALSNLILVTPQSNVGIQPQNKPVNNGSPGQQPPAILFNYEGEQTVTLQSEITDHYIEDNTAINDQIALRPETITTHGYIGELNDVTPFGLQTVKALADKLTAISAYTPAISQTAVIAYNTAFQLYQVAANAANTAVAAWSTITGTGGDSVINGNGITVNRNQSKQQVAFQQFYGYWKNRTLFTVQTPWAIFQNMAIQSLRAVQDAETRVITDFEVTFKILRFANTVTSNSGNIFNNFQSRAANQAAQIVNLGTSTPSPAQSLSSQLGINQLVP